MPEPVLHVVVEICGTFGESETDNVRSYDAEALGENRNREAPVGPYAHSRPRPVQKNYRRAFANVVTVGLDAGRADALSNSRFWLISAPRRHQSVV